MSSPGLVAKAGDSKVLRFLATGLLNTAFGYSVYAVLVFCGVPYLVALLLATVAGVVFNYFTFGRLVFRAAPSGKTFPRFVAAYAVTYGANAAALYLLEARFGIDPYLAQAACIPLSVLVSWVLMNHWVYENERS